MVSSPYARAGELYRVWSKHFGRDDDQINLVIAADTQTLNPTFSQREIDRAFRDDPISAWSEYGRNGEIRFRSDVSGFVADEAIAAVVPNGVRELPPDFSREAIGHFDASTGSGSDAAALAVAYRGVPAELAMIRSWKPPFNPRSAATEAAASLRRYGVSSITIDRFAPGLRSVSRTVSESKYKTVAFATGHISWQWRWRKAVLKPIDDCV